MTPAETLVDALRTAGGRSLAAVILFGSQLVRARPDAHSAWDLVVIVDDYGAFHRDLVRSGHHRRPAWLLSALARVLPPSITAFAPGEEAPLAKCAIVSLRRFAVALGPGAADHFLKGRMVQRVELLWSRDDDARSAVEAALSRARSDVLGWTAPHLPDTFDAAEFARRMLQISYAGELRPESRDRVDQVFEAQREFLVRLYAGVLARSAGPGGSLVAAGAGRFRLARTPRWNARLGLSLYFMRSKARATTRWLKHILTFNDWLTYIQRKVERRTGMEIHITPWERRLPLILLWPKVIRVLRYRGDTPSAPRIGP